MKTNRTLIAICIGTLFASTSLQAKDKWEYHNDGWEKTKSYGSVMISQDSAKQWGPWEEFVEPAAGAPSIAFIGAGEGDPYLPIPTPIPPTPVVTGCGDGEWCGYMAVGFDYRPSQHRYRGEGGSYRPYLNGFEPVDIALQFTQPESGYWYGRGSVNLVLTSDLGSYAGAGMETGPVPVWFWGKQGWFDGHMHEPYVSLEGGFDGYNWYTRTWVNKYATMGVLEARVTDYVYESGNGEGGHPETVSVYAPFVAGQLTPLSDLNSLNAGNVTAWYRGETALAGGSVCMTVSFGPGTWSGTWNGGYGPVGFNANGTITGANFASTNVTGSGVVASVSSVRGSFYGPQAAAAGGIVDVTKTAGYSGESVSLMSSGPSTTRYVDVFLANKTYQTSGSSIQR